MRACSTISKESRSCRRLPREVFRELDDRRLEAGALVSMGLAYRDQGRFDAALGCFEQCLLAFRQVVTAWVRPRRSTASGKPRREG